MVVTFDLPLLVLWVARGRIFHHTVCLVLYQLCVEVSGVCVCVEGGGGWERGEGEGDDVSSSLMFYVCTFLPLGSHGSRGGDQQQPSKQVETRSHGYRGQCHAPLTLYMSIHYII